jgi:hypothetical protein
MRLKYAQPIWKCVLDAAREIGKEIFTAQDVINKVHETVPEVPATSIRSYVIAMAPKHPSSSIYVSTHKNHPYFEYLGNGKYGLMKETRGRIAPKKNLKDDPARSKNSKNGFLQKYNESILSWTIENEAAIISGRKSYCWNDRPLIECLEERNHVSRLLVLSRIRNGGGVDVGTLDEVMSWGGFGSFPLRDKGEALRITSEAFSLLDKGNVSGAILKLLSVNKVGISSASKIIGLFDQNQLAIYDSRVGTALRTLKHESERIIKCPPGRKRCGDACSDEQWAENYEKFIWVLEVIRKLLNEHGYPFSIADVEMGLFMMGK